MILWKICIHEKVCDFCISSCISVDICGRETEGTLQTVIGVRTYGRGMHGVGEINPRFASRRICSLDSTTDNPWPEKSLREVSREWFTYKNWQWCVFPQYFQNIDKKFCLDAIIPIIRDKTMKFEKSRENKISEKYDEFVLLKRLSFFYLFHKISSIRIILQMFEINFKIIAIANNLFSHHANRSWRSSAIFFTRTVPSDGNFLPVKSWLKWQTNGAPRKIRRASNSWISSLEHICRTELSSYIDASRCRTAIVLSFARLK